MKQHKAPTTENHPKYSVNAQAPWGQAGLGCTREGQCGLALPATAWLHFLSVTQHILGFLCMSTSSDTQQGFQTVITPVSHKMRKENSWTTQEQSIQSSESPGLLFWKYNSLTLNIMFIIYQKIQAHALLSPKIQIQINSRVSKWSWSTSNL